MGCGGGVRAAGSALAVRPRSSLLTRQSGSKNLEPLLSRETSSSFKPWRGLGRIWRGFFVTLFLSACFSSLLSPRIVAVVCQFWRFGRTLVSRSIFAPSIATWETVGHSVGCHSRAPRTTRDTLWGLQFASRQRAVGSVKNEFSFGQSAFRRRTKSSQKYSRPATTWSQKGIVHGGDPRREQPPRGHE